MLEKEVWRDVKDYEGHYQVSNLGRVKSLKFNKERILSHCIKKSGYYDVCLKKFGGQCNYYIHQLVAIAFLNHEPNGYELVVDHINNDKSNNRLDNLQLITQRENASKNRVGTSKHTGVHWSKHDKLWRSIILINGKSIYLGGFKCELAAAKAYQDKLKEINKIKKGGRNE